ncbi:MAG: PD-(D/E)XK nuclease family protein [Erysipelotrichaceae bacterium]|nr:PD-(D/E)XK nuclease family protein [Erysipelotrichaceae bacterium]
MKDFIEKLKDRKTLLICPNVFKNRVLEYLFQEKEVFDIKFIDLNEYKKNILFDYDLNAVRYLNSKYGLSISNAREILENLYFVEDKRYGVKKLDDLVTYKTELEQEGLLIHNRLFDRFFEGRDIVIAGYGEPDRFTEGIVRGEIIFYEEIKKIYKINTFEDIEAELEYVYNSISDLIRNGTDINKIHVLNAGSDYEAYISRFNTYYGFVIDQGNNEKLIGTSLAKNFLDKIDSSDKQTIYEDLLAMENDRADKLINIINRYTGYDLKDVKEFVIDDLKNTGVSSGSFNNVVSCDDLFTPFDKDDHVFLIGFNEQFPRFKTDTEYISNSLRPLLNMSTIEEENELIRKNVRGYLSSIDNLHISWCEKSPFRKYNQCNLYTSEECEYRKIDKGSYEYCDEVNRLKYAYMQDRLQKYGRSDDDYGLLHKEYGDNDYLTYSNVFKGLNDEQIDQFNSVKLSYTPMNDFYMCQFRYYLDYVMKIGDNSGNFNTRVGNICHEVLKDLYEDKDFDFERSWTRAFKNEEDRLAEGEKLF